MPNARCDDVLSKSRRVLLKTGLWPTSKRTKYAIPKLIFNFIFHSTILTMIVCNIVDAKRRNDNTKLNWMMCVLCPVLTYIAKVTTISTNKIGFYSILDDLKSRTFNAHNGKLNEHIRQIDKISKLLLGYLTTTVLAFSAAGSILPIILQTEVMIFPAPMNLGKYSILYKIIHLFMTTYVSFNTVGLDVLYMSLLGLCRAQLDILEDRLSYILEDVTNNRNDIEINVMMRYVVRECSILHDAVNEFVEKLNVLLSFPLFVQYLTGCFVICNAVLQLKILGGLDLASILITCTYSSVVFVQMFAYHWLGNEIIFKSEKIIESCYLSKWYNLDLISQKSLILLMERAKRPLIVQLYGFVFISLSSLGVVVRWSYSVFAVMKASYG